MDENSGSRQALQYVLMNGSNVLSEDTAKRGSEGGKGARKKQKSKTKKIQERKREKKNPLRREVDESDWCWRGAGVCVHVCIEAGFGVWNSVRLEGGVYERCGFMETID